MKSLYVIRKINREKFVFCGSYALQLPAQGFMQVLLCDRQNLWVLMCCCHNSPVWFPKIKFREMIRILSALQSSCHRFICYNWTIVLNLDFVNFYTADIYAFIMLLSTCSLEYKMLCILCYEGIRSSWLEKDFKIFSVCWR